MNKRRKKSYCFNCKTSLSLDDNFCRKCGQENHDKRVSFKTLIDDFLGDYFTFDSKIWRSLMLLCFSPGQLTLNYSKGELTNFIRPIRLMLFMSLLYVVSLNFFIDGLGFKITNDSISINENNGGELYLNISKNYGSLNSYLEKEMSDDSYLNRALVSGLYRITASGKNVFNEIVKQTSNLLFFLLPFIGLIIKVTFWRDKKLFPEHFVHSLHLYSFFFLIFSLGLLFIWLFSGSYIGLLLIFLIFYVYLFLSYRKVHKRNFLITFSKVVSSTILFFILLTFGFVLSSLITISMY